MNQLTIGKRVYNLGKVTNRRMTQAQWDEAKTHLRRDDRAHVVKIENDFFYVLQVTFDPKFKTVDIFWRSLTLSHVIPEQTRDDSDDDRLSIRSIRGREQL